MGRFAILDDKSILTKILNNKKLIHAFLYVLFLLIHFYLSMGADFARILGDEAGYYSNARFFAIGGNLPILGDPLINIHFYYPGYSLLLTPLFFATKNHIVLVKLIQYANALIMSFIPLLVYNLIPHIRTDLSGGEKILATMAISFFAPYLIWSNAVMSEVLNPVLFLILAFLVYKLSNKTENYLIWIGVAGCYSYLWLTHPRFIAVLPALLIALFLIALKGKNYKGLALFMGSLVVCFLIAGAVLYRMESKLVESSIGNLFQSNSDAINNFYGLQDRLKLVLNFEKLPHYLYDFLQHLAGHLFYLFASSFGLVPLGIFYSLSIIKNEPMNSERYVFAVFSILSIFFMTILSSANTVFLPEQFLRSSDQSSHYLYGRYNDTVIIPVFLIGVVFFMKERYIGKKFFWVSCSALIISGIIYFIMAEKLERAPFIIVDSLGLTYKSLFIGDPWVFKLIPFLTIFAAIAVVLYFFSLISRKLTLALLTVIFLWTAVYDNKNFFVGMSEFYDAQRQLITPLEKYLKDKKEAVISYDKSTFFHIPYLIYFMNFGNFKYQHFDFLKGETPVSDAVISAHDVRNVYRDARLAGIENSFDNQPAQKLWILPGRNLDDMLSKGFIYPENYPCQLPDSAFKSSIKLGLKEGATLKISKRHKIRIPITIKHAGSGSPWPILYTKKSKNMPFEVLTDANSDYIVRFGIIIYRYDEGEREYKEIERQKSNLKHTLYPGQEDYLTIHLNIFRDSIDGIYMLRLSPIQEGVGWFFEKGDNPLDIFVEKRKKYIKILTGNEAPRFSSKV